MSFAYALFRASDAETFLRRVLAFDAVTSGAMGLALIAAAGTLGPLLNLPVPLLRGVGLSFIPFVALVAYAATRKPASRALGLTVAGLNALWVILSFGLLLSGSVTPNALGMVFVAAQAVFVGILAELQVVGARRLATA
ncbi:hypothetical protein [Phreatobacter cathodiphilus]|uniref:Uncharacterized protein n=1 Tax=Phreatobacter cathodiphilus TaxID=1868589 RepID=A0A2S0NG20_9HYPH|nr:hypothetical protein [Phreatobacter cathodiphilus]AVO46881.1 hypothetical protein C6569_18465 [Phreatobacter cathodiphilus]